MDFFFLSFRKVMLETGLLLQSFWTYLLGCHTERLSHSPILLTLMSAFVYVDSDLPNTMNGSLNCSNAPIKAAKRPLLQFGSEIDLFCPSGRTFIYFKLSQAQQCILEKIKREYSFLISLTLIKIWGFSSFVNFFLFLNLVVED